MIQIRSKMTSFDNTYNQQIQKILIALSIARSPVSLDYISIHTKINEPQNALNIMEEQGLVRRTSPSTWSCSGHPMFEITPTTQKTLLKYVKE